MSNYDNSMVPSESGIDAIVELHIQEISTIDELHSLFELDILFRCFLRNL